MRHIVLRVYCMSEQEIANLTNGASNRYAGEFHEDLHYPFNGLTVRPPALRGQHESCGAYSSRSAT